MWPNPAWNCARTNFARSNEMHEPAKSGRSGRSHPTGTHSSFRFEFFDLLGRDDRRVRRQIKYAQPVHDAGRPSHREATTHEFRNSFAYGYGATLSIALDAAEDIIIKRKRRTHTTMMSN